MKVLSSVQFKLIFSIFLQHSIITYLWIRFNEKTSNSVRYVIWIKSSVRCFTGIRRLESKVEFASYADERTLLSYIWSGLQNKMYLNLFLNKCLSLASIGPLISTAVTFSDKLLKRMFAKARWQEMYFVRFRALNLNFAEFSTGATITTLIIEITYFISIGITVTTLMIEITYSLHLNGVRLFSVLARTINARDDGAWHKKCGVLT